MFGRELGVKGFQNKVLWGSVPEEGSPSSFRWPWAKPSVATWVQEGLAEEREFCAGGSSQGQAGSWEAQAQIHSHYKHLLCARQQSQAGISQAGTAFLFSFVCILFCVSFWCMKLWFNNHTLRMESPQ